MSKASEDKLSELHGVVADVLKAQITRQEKETTINLKGEIEETGKMVYMASPATIATAVKFLKDNEIVCDIDNNTGMQELRETLSKKQLRSRSGDAKDAASTH